VNDTEGRDAGCRHASLPFSAALAVALLCAQPAAAQNARPWLDWKTLPTEHFVFHYPAEYREWTISLAQRMEGIRAQVTNAVGASPVRRVNVVVDASVRR
jgi:hypothetical protein